MYPWSYLQHEINTSSKWTLSITKVKNEKVMALNKK